MTTSRQFDNLVREVMEIETVLATVVMLTVGSTVAEQLGQPLDERQRKLLGGEVIKWAAEAIDRIELAKRVATIGDN